jgi:hypothetical protein
MLARGFPLPHRPFVEIHGHCRSFPVEYRVHDVPEMLKLAQSTLLLRESALECRQLNRQIGGFIRPIMSVF